MCDSKTGRTILSLAVALTLGMLEAASAQTRSTPVTSCGQVLEAPGDYHLTGDLGPCPTEYGIWIQASNVRLNLAGFTLSGGFCSESLPVGIYASEDASNIHIEGGTMTGFCIGISVAASNSRVSGMTVSTQGFGFGIGVTGSHTVIEANIITNNATGVLLTELAALATVRSNHVYDNGCGICDESSRSRIRSNIVDGNPVGISVGGQRNTLRRNVVFRNGSGIWLSERSNNAKVAGNTANGNARAGIAIAAGGDSHEVVGNRVRGNATVDLLDGNANCAANRWRTNGFATDSVAGESDDGPGVGCIR